MNAHAAVMGVLVLLFISPSWTKAKYTATPYGHQKVVFDFYFDSPEKMGAGLFWLRSLIKPLSEAPYNYSSDLLEIVVVVHGTEVVTLAKKNYSKYQTTIDRMRYYVDLGVKFKICEIAMQDYGYRLEDFYDFVEVVPSAMTELVHWQSKGYALITPQVLEKKQANDKIR